MTRSQNATAVPGVKPVPKDLGKAELSALAGMGQVSWRGSLQIP